MANPPQRQDITPSQREAAAPFEATAATASGEPFRVSFTPGGIEVSGKLTSAEQADELIAAIEALKLLLKRTADIQRPACGGDDPPAEQGAEKGVSFMITREQKVALRERGYSDKQIREMKPEDAHRALGLLKQEGVPPQNDR